MKVVFLRHGESTWNRKALFTGWANPPLSSAGIERARKAGETLKKKGYSFDIVFSNIHQRTLKTANIVLGVLGLRLQIEKTWRLNERHYGALIGLNKPKAAEEYGDKQVLLWRRSYNVKPPMLKKTDKLFKAIAASYPDVPKKDFPLGESLADTYKRSVPYWKKVIVPAIKSGKRVLVVASHNSLRAVIKYVNHISNEDIAEFTIPYGIPLVFEFDENLNPKNHYYLGTAAEVRKTLASIASQGKAK
jgi:2,3-bisphosphoglycerate-dependent phosphoglycerate mutase